MPSFAPIVSYGRGLYDPDMWNLLEALTNITFFTDAKRMADTAPTAPSRNRKAHLIAAVLLVIVGIGSMLIFALDLISGS